MLRELTIRNFVLIDRLHLDLDKGLTTVTGETGSGKSIIFDAIALVLGGRARKGLAGTDDKHAVITATFALEPNHPAGALLSDMGLSAEPEDSSPDEITLILRRSLDGAGRGKVYANDHAISLTLLQTLGAHLAEIHAHNDARRFADEHRHIAMLDVYADHDALLNGVQGAWQAHREAQESLGQARREQEEAREQQDYLDFAVDELETLAPKEAEETHLGEQRRTMMTHEAVAGDLAATMDRLGSEEGPRKVLANCLRRLGRVSEKAPELVSEPASLIGSALDLIVQAEDDLERSHSQIDFDADAINAIEERLFALRNVARKHRVPPDDLPALTKTLRAQRDGIARGAAKVVDLERLCDETKSTFEEEAQRLSESRRRAAGRMEKGLKERLGPLCLKEAKFIVAIESAPSFARSTGIDKVRFLVAANPGSKPDALGSVASGGELSRLFLALRLAFTARKHAPAVLFDEIDTGVGGRVASAVGSCLATLSERVQVLVVTHSAQVAGCADHHLIVRKSLDANKRAKTSVRKATDEEKFEEIARMLAGESVTNEARAAAIRLVREGAEHDTSAQKQSA